jgi:HD-like signal output (HDOD) protein
MGRIDQEVAIAPPRTLSQWVRLISDEEMPVFAHTARHVAGLATSVDTSSGDLARVVLMDSAMTTRVLRMANSAYYNPGVKRITTVSRAIVILGFETIRSIALSIAMVDTLLRGNRHDRVVTEMAHAFHAAVQARSFAARRGDAAPEEVFIAALLFRLGAMAFWCFPHGYDEALDTALADAPQPAKAERAILGFALKDLTAALNREWSLSELLGHTLDGRHGHDTRVKIIEVASSLASAVNEHGWDSAQTRKLIARAAELSGAPEDEIASLVQDNARQAVRAATDYGAEVAARQIPVPQTADAATPAAAAAPAERAVDPDFQLRILREISTMLSERVDVNGLLGMILEGIFRGIAMDRAVLALVGSDSPSLKAKYVLGVAGGLVGNRFDFAVDDGDRNPIIQILNGGEPAWVSRGSPRWRQCQSSDLVGCLGDAEFFAFPIHVGGRPRGMFYADRGHTGRVLDERDFDSFRHLCEQAAIGLAVAGPRG